MRLVRCVSEPLGAGESERGVAKNSCRGVAKQKRGRGGRGDVVAQSEGSTAPTAAHQQHRTV